MSESVQIQDAGENALYILDWTAWLGGSDTLAISAWAINPAGATPVLSSQSESGNLTQVFVADPTLGAIYVLTNTVTTTGGRIGVRSITIRGFSQ